MLTYIHMLTEEHPSIYIKRQQHNLYYNWKEEVKRKMTTWRKKWSCISQKNTIHHSVAWPSICREIECFLVLWYRRQFFICFYCDDDAHCVAWRCSLSITTIPTYTSYTKRASPFQPLYEHTLYTTLHSAPCPHNLLRIWAHNINTLLDWRWWLVDS